MKSLGIILCLLLSLNAYAGDVVFGTIKGIKLYDFSGDKSIKVYFNADATNINVKCVSGSSIVAILSIASHDEATVNRMLSMLLSANMAGKKVRIHSAVDSCEIDFVAIQETYY